MWEESWEDGAVVQDAATDTYANPQKVHTVKFHGQYFDIDGPHLVEPSVQRTPVLFQAGASTRGSILLQNMQKLYFRSTTHWKI